MRSEAKRELNAAQQAALQQRLQAARQRVALAQTICPQPDEAERVLSFAQERMWFLEQLAPEQALYNRPLALRLGGHLDRAALETAVGEILRRHAVLRTTYPSLGGAPQPAVAPVELVSLTQLAFANLEAAWPTILEKSQQRLPLDQAPLWRGYLIQLGELEQILLLVFHHIAFDAWSARRLAVELQTLYAAALKGEALAQALPALPIQYSDWAAWQCGQRQEAHLDYWQARLKGAAEALELPLLRGRPAEFSYHAGVVNHHLPPRLLERLQAFCTAHNATLFMLLLAGYQTLLYRYSGQTDLTVGVPVTLRTLPETEGLIGNFINTLPLRGELNGQMSFGELLDQVQANALEAFAHQELPLERLLQELPVERQRNRAPLFQTLFNLENIPSRTGESGPGALDMTVLELPAGATYFDVSVEVIFKEGGLECSFAYNQALFEAWQIEQVAAHYEHLLEAALADPSQDLDHLPMVSLPEKRRRVRNDMSLTERDTPGDSRPFLQSGFEAWAERTPQAVACVADGQTLTYAELEQRANALAHHLQTLGVGREKLVGLYLPRSSAAVAAILAILKAGGAYLPLDTDAPAERLRLTLEEARPLVTLSAPEQAGRLPSSAGQVLVVDESGRVESASEAAPLGRPANLCQPENLAYVLYTSGTTGRPKGVCIEHRQIDSYLQAIQVYLGWDQGEALSGAGFAFLHPLTVDAGLTTLFGALGSGATLHILSPETALDGRNLAAYLREQPIDLLKIAPTHLQALQAEVGITALLPRRWLMLAGEAARWEWVQAIQVQAPGCQVLNEYGPTETSVGATICRVAELPPGDYVNFPLGWPLANTHCVVLDANQQPAPLGVPGELYIGGAGVGRGYLGRPELTAERFLSDPWQRDGERLYRSGDRVRQRPGGLLEFLGRLDSQVKLRGVRIELGEIEAALNEHPQVEVALAQLRTTGGEPVLTAYVVRKPGSPLATAASLRSSLRQVLPDSMIPGAFIFLERLPRNPHGKIDLPALQALPLPGRAENVESTGRAGIPAYQAARNPVEAVLAGLWEETMQLERVSIWENFFDLGGHSLLAVRLAARLRDVFEIALPLRSLFDKPTIVILS